MATERITLGINLRQNKNSRNAATYGKYYPEVDQQKTLSLRGFADHMSSHGSIYNRAIVEGVLQQICDCLPELLSQGVRVKFDGLGIFYATAQVVKAAGVESIAAMDGLNPNDLVKGIRIRFLPDSTKLDKLTGAAFKEKCTLELRNIVDTKEVTINSKPQKVQTIKPVVTAVAEWKEQNAGTSGGGGDDDEGPATGQEQG